MAVFWKLVHLGINLPNTFCFKMIRNLYHTQEKRTELLTAPCKCTREDAWLGEGYYFWEDYKDAIEWGRNSKMDTGGFQIYYSEIDCTNILDTVFNTEHYYFWMNAIEEKSKRFFKLTGRRMTIKELNNYFRDENTFAGVDGILFADCPNNKKTSLVRVVEKDGKSFAFPYRKRIQLVVFNPRNVITFKLDSSETRKF